jgi:hypothetical protein
VGLFSDSLHNFSDALTALPIGLAFLIGRRSPTPRYTYGYGRAEDLAGVTVVMAVSAVIAAWEAVHRLIHAQHVGHLAPASGGGKIGRRRARGCKPLRRSTGPSTPARCRPPQGWTTVRWVSFATSRGPPFRW